MTAVEKLTEPQLATKEHTDAYLRLIGTHEFDAQKFLELFNEYAASVSGLMSFSPSSLCAEAGMYGTLIDKPRSRSQDLRQYNDNTPVFADKLLRANDKVLASRKRAQGEAQKAVTAVLYQLYSRCTVQRAVELHCPGKDGYKIFKAKKALLRAIVIREISR